MISKESIKYSLNNLKQRKTRSFFTIFSIFIGITTIFIFISFGIGLYGYIEEFSSSSSADKIFIQAKGGSSAFGLDTTFGFTENDLKVVEKTAGVYDASGIYMKPVEIVQGKKRLYTLMIGYDPKKPLIMDIFNIGIYEGRELAGDEKNIVLGYNYQFDNLIFQKGYSLGERIDVGGEKIKIVGFYEKVGSPQDDAQVYVTNSYVKNIYGDNLSYNWIVARIDVSNIGGVVENVEKNLRKERGQEKGKEDFFVQSFSDMMETYSTILNLVIGFVILIAFISVLVSGVNTANTIITSVIERKKEIGIMKSIGARNSDILGIFLFESSFLGFVAGIIGCSFGWLLSVIGGRILDNLGYGFLQPSFPPILFMGCIVFATLTGAISGFFPAYRASKINPVDALHYE